MRNIYKSNSLLILKCWWMITRQLVSSTDFNPTHMHDDFTEICNSNRNELNKNNTAIRLVTEWNYGERSSTSLLLHHHERRHRPPPQNHYHNQLSLARSFSVVIDNPTENAVIFALSCKLNLQLLLSRYTIP